MSKTQSKTTWYRENKENVKLMGENKTNRNQYQDDRY